MESGKWNFDELFLKYRIPLLIFLSGIVLLALGAFIIKSGVLGSPTKIEVLNGPTSIQNTAQISAEISGAVITPGVYKLLTGSRVDDLLIVAGGFSADADRAWTDKYLNRAAKLTDGQKVFIPSHSEVLSAKTAGGDQTVSPSFSSDSLDKININTASLSQLDTLPGIGPTYGQNIIEHRPYSNVDELLSKGVLKSSVYNKIKELITVY